MRSNIVPPNRFITIALLIGILALIVYGIVRRDPATILIVIALAVFFGAPVLFLFNANRLQRRRPPAPDADASDDEPSDYHDER